MKTGVYRNNLGVEIDVQRQVVGVREYQVMGIVYEGVMNSGPFGFAWYIVTAEGLASGGYELIEERADA